MSLESGSVSYRMFYMRPTLPRDFVENFASHALPPIDTLSVGEISGWVSGRHLLDRRITEDNATLASYVRLTLCKAERKIPPALLKAECKMEELAELQARGIAFLKRTEKSEIKKQVTERLLPDMPPTLTGIDFVCEQDGNILYATATSDTQIDAFTLHFSQATGVDLIPVTPFTVAAKERKTDLRDLPPTSFSPDCDDDTAETQIGRDFLTWLWYFSEACGGVASLDDGEFAVAIEGPLSFVFEGNGAHETVLRKGMPVVSAEAKTALTSGKKLKRAKVTFARGEDMWSLTLDADEFVCRGVQLPKGENLDLASKFQDRVLAMETLRQIITGFYNRFLDERLDPKEWQAVREDIHKWVGARKARA
jgi:hypothetical protein